MGGLETSSDKVGKVNLLWVGIGLLIASLAVACGEAATPRPSGEVSNSPSAPTPATTPTPSTALSPGLTPEEFFSLVEQAISRQGFVFHTSSETVVSAFEDSDSTQRLWTVEAWLDVVQGRGRSDFQKDPSSEADLPDRVTSIVFDDTEVSVVPLPEELKEAVKEGLLRDPSGNPITSIEEKKPRDRKATLCPFMTSSLLSMLMYSCENLSAPPSGKVKVDLEYEGQPAAAVTYLEEGENPVAFYVHRESLLPLAWVIEYGEPGRRSAWVTSYKNDFVPLDSLPPDYNVPTWPVSLVTMTRPVTIVNKVTVAPCGVTASAAETW